MGGQAKIERYHDKASQQLHDVVDQFNKLDPAGPQQVKCYVYESGWNKIQSLSHGTSYFFNPNQENGGSLPFGSVPEECKNVQWVDVKYQDQGSRFCKPPKNGVFTNDLKTIPSIYKQGSNDELELNEEYKVK